MVSEYIRSQFLSLGIPENRLILMHNFIDLEKHGLETNRTIYLDPGWVGDNKLVGYAGRLTYNKGLRHLVEAITILRDEPIKFLIAGIGPYQKKLVKLIRVHGIEHKVKLFGYLDNLSHFFNTIDLFTSPSLMESFGLVHLEAQASGCVVVAFDIEAIRETIGAENALLAKQGDTKDLARCIQEALYDEELRRHLAQRGLENAKKFSMSSQMKKTR